jgi:hypothetical protein
MREFISRLPRAIDHHPYQHDQISSAICQPSTATIVCNESISSIVVDLSAQEEDSPVLAEHRENNSMSWVCECCTYHHTSAEEVIFLACCLCSTPRAMVSNNTTNEQNEASVASSTKKRGPELVITSPTKKQSSIESWLKKKEN